MKNKTGFTLLELIIAVIVVGTIAVVAFPRMFSAIEFSRGNEALYAIASIRSSVEQCYLMNGRVFDDCDAGQASGPGGDWSKLGIEDPSLAPNAHFWYHVEGLDQSDLRITAYRSTIDGGDTASRIIMEVDNEDDESSAYIRTTGTGAFLSIK